jgi:succinyl-CoA synthetase beta subunit
MKTHEYQAREILQGYGIPFPPAAIATTPEEAEAVARDLGGKVVVKAQALVGGRGKAGGIKRADSAGAAREAAAAILGAPLKGRPVRKVMVAQTVPIAREYYLGAVLDRSAKAVTIMVSAVGGMDIEEVARTSPEAIVRVSADPLLGLADYQTRDLARGAGLSGDQARAFRAIAAALFKAFFDNDCTLLEVNPLALTDDGRFVALDSKMIVDDNALSRRPSLAALSDPEAEEPAETEARKVGVSYIELEGNVGCLVNGAGLAMATMDVIELFGGEPANFLDIGGGAHIDQVRSALRILLHDPYVRAVLVNIFGGITRCDVVAQAVVDAIFAGEVTVPVVARLVGTNAAEGRAILEGTEVVQAATMTEAAKKVVALAGGVTHSATGAPAAGAEAGGAATGVTIGTAIGDAPGTATGPAPGGLGAGS